MAATRFFILSALLWLLPLSADAKLFRNAYVSFELPNRWECRLEGTEWVCSSLLRDSSREAIIILTAKEAGPSDTLEAYEAHLKTPRVIPATKGKPSRSAFKHLKRRQIGGSQWVDSMHLGSEIPNYYTRYMATVKDRLAILVTFSAHQRHYSKYSQDFHRAIESLNVIASKSLFDVTPTAPTGGLAGGGEIIGPPGGGIVDDSGLELPPEPTGGGNGMKIIAGALLIIAIGGYFVMKKRS
ncbi:MAG TPA: hypothetical protein VFV50_04655 [Bdellovibrionales bacterium]|nr:hypothetical protein [Bdellovibrionales bacterium]